MKWIQDRLASVGGWRYLAPLVLMQLKTKYQQSREIGYYPPDPRSSGGLPRRRDRISALIYLHGAEGRASVQLSSILMY